MYQRKIHFQFSHLSKTMMKFKSAILTVKFNWKKSMKYLNDEGSSKLNIFFKHTRRLSIVSTLKQYQCQVSIWTNFTTNRKHQRREFHANIPRIAKTTFINLSTILRRSCRPFSASPSRSNPRPFTVPLFDSRSRLSVRPRNESAISQK